jgi:hypothetical protein
LDAVRDGVPDGLQRKEVDRIVAWPAPADAVAAV